MRREQRPTSILLDTELFVKLFVKENGWEEVAQILRAAEEGRLKAGISVISLTEIYYVYRQRVGKKTALQRVEYMRDTPYIDKYAVDMWASIQAGIFKAEYKIPIADALIVATALQERATIISNDHHLKKIKEIQVLNETQMYQSMK